MPGNGSENHPTGAAGKRSQLPTVVAAAFPTSRGPRLQELGPTSMAPVHRGVLTDADDDGPEQPSTRLLADDELRSSVAMRC